MCRKCIPLYIFLLFSILTKAQNPQFGHFYSNAMLYNPAFTGNVDLGRFSLNYRNQWPGISAKFVSYAASYDHFFQKAKSGIGIQFIGDRAGGGGLTTNMVNALYSYQIPVNRKVAVLAGLKAGYQVKRYDLSQFTFADQIARDNAPASVVSGLGENASNPNFGFGAAFYHVEKYWFGLSVDHINEPDISITDNLSKLPMLASVQAGWNFDANKNFNGRSLAKITLAALYKSQLKWDQLDIGAYYKSNPIIFGIWYRGVPIKKNEARTFNADAIMLLAGLKFDRISFSYSYDVTISKLAPNTQGAHELSLILEYPKPKRRRKRFFTLPCPKF